MSDVSVRFRLANCRTRQWIEVYLRLSYNVIASRVCERERARAHRVCANDLPCQFVDTLWSPYVCLFELLAVCTYTHTRARRAPGCACALSLWMCRTVFRWWWRRTRSRNTAVWANLPDLGSISLNRCAHSIFQFLSKRTVTICCSFNSNKNRFCCWAIFIVFVVRRLSSGECWRMRLSNRSTLKHFYYFEFSQEYYYLTQFRD